MLVFVFFQVIILIAVKYFTIFFIIYNVPQYIYTVCGPYIRCCLLLLLPLFIGSRFLMLLLLHCCCC